MLLGNLTNMKKRKMVFQLCLVEVVGTGGDLLTKQETENSGYKQVS